jgi:predicted amidohydrolase YtcJ
MLFSQHHDAPVCLSSAIRSCRGLSPAAPAAGASSGPASAYRWTWRSSRLLCGGAYQHYEEGRRGSIEAGKLADFVVLDKNPHKVPILALSELKVVETIKEGRGIYVRE